MPTRLNREQFTAVIRTATSVIDPKLGGEFAGTKAEAMDAVLAWAEAIRDDNGDDARTRSQLTGWLANAQHDRVAEMFAAVLVRHLDVVKQAAGDKCKHCGETITYLDKLQVGKDAAGWYLDYGNDECPANHYNQHEPA